ncbi:ribbon-helix-helix protein, CopG family [Streptomyces sp. NPDC002754]
MALNLRLPEKTDRTLADRAEREGRSKHDLILEAIDEANERAEMSIHTLLDELMFTQAETLDRLQ